MLSVAGSRQRSNGPEKTRLPASSETESRYPSLARWSRSSTPPTDQINRRPQLQQRIVRRLNSINPRNRIEDDLLLLTRRVGNRSSQRECAKFQNLAIFRPMNRRIIDHIAIVRDLHHDLELDRTLPTRSTISVIR